MAWFFAHRQLASGGESAGGPCLTQAPRSHFLQPLPFADGESSNPSQLLAALISDSRSVLEMRSTFMFRCAEFRAPRGPARSRGARRWGLLPVPPGGNGSAPSVAAIFMQLPRPDSLSPGGLASQSVAQRQNISLRAASPGWAAGRRSPGAPASTFVEFQQCPGVPAPWGRGCHGPLVGVGSSSLMREP